MPDADPIPPEGVWTRDAIVALAPYSQDDRHKNEFLLPIIKEQLGIARRNNRPGPTMCSCPMNSSSVRGRMRAASGASLSASSFRRSAKRSFGLGMGVLYTNT